MNTEQRRKIIRAASLAPSPDNNQPWRFRFDDNFLFLRDDPKRTLPGDVDKMFDMLGFGAAIENACLAARKLGYRADAYPPQIEFNPGGVPDPLADFIESRCTDRRLFSTRPITANTLLRLSTESQKAMPELQIDWLTDRNKIYQLSKLIATADRIRLMHRSHHAELFRQLRFSSSEAERTRDGLDVRLLGLPIGGKLLLRSMRSWKTMNVLNTSGLSRLLVIPSMVAVIRSGAVAVLSLSQPRPADFVVAGRGMQRLWLAATQAGLAVQPLGALPMFLKSGNAPLNEEFNKIMPEVLNRRTVMILRIGYGRPPQKIRSLRLPIEDMIDGE